MAEQGVATGSRKFGSRVYLQLPVLGQGESTGSKRFESSSYSFQLVPELDVAGRSSRRWEVPKQGWNRRYRLHSKIETTKMHSMHRASESRQHARNNKQNNESAEKMCVS